MNAVVFKGVEKGVVVEKRPIPKAEPGSVVVKVRYAGLCGSDLHTYRGIEPAGENPDFIMGHELTGVIAEVGEGVKNFQVGDRVVCPFTISCGECFYCKLDLSSRCVKSQCFGTPGLPGAQAEYVRIPLADSTVFNAPDGIKDQNLILMADIFPLLLAPPTQYFAASNATARLPAGLPHAPTAAVIGCGPVGLCALVSLRHLLGPAARLFAVDSNGARLARAASVAGATPLNFREMPPGVAVADAIRAATPGGRGADAALELVGVEDALRTAFEAVRPFGVVSSVGVHNGPAGVGFTGAEGYDKNVQLVMGRCPVRSLFPRALEVLRANEGAVECLTENVVPLSGAVEAYERFERGEVQKFVFKADE
ncbi:alcohol dehydrogenase [Diplodia corticola]|uniref:Alcohol dehydrogenase n=1 Tax=Diplodia corticola TaxID=236234 RepID=A0A1J9QN63_9PEZI|nr:alcohol dehydrogenase [Diplodia corticola]OJD29904.1 alcohol dehydrogenase [Diplodia corticola]